MAQQYDHLTLEERCAIARLHEDGQSLRQIAAALDRSPSTISRELKRNRGTKIGYKPVYAQEQARARRWTGSKLERDDELRKLVLGCLQNGYPLSRSLGACGSKRRQQPSVTRASTASSTPRSAAPKTLPGGSICHVPSSSVVIVAAREAARFSTSKTVFPSANVHSISMHAVSQDTGKPTMCCSADMASPCWSPRNVPRDLSCWPNPPAVRPHQPPPSCITGWCLCHPNCAAP